MPTTLGKVCRIERDEIMKMKYLSEDHLKSLNDEALLDIVYSQCYKFETSHLASKILCERKILHET